jgi:hypothetical protein
VRVVIRAPASRNISEGRKADDHQGAECDPAEAPADHSQDRQQARRTHPVDLRHLTYIGTNLAAV